MQRAMAREAEAEREERGKIIAAEGEALSAGKLAEAADVIAEHPVALQLRNLQVLSEIAIEHNSTIIFPAQLMDSLGSLNSFIGKESTVSAYHDGIVSADGREHGRAPFTLPGDALGTYDSARAGSDRASCQDGDK
jgi:hypothetical protein